LRARFFALLFSIVFLCGMTAAYAEPVPFACTLQPDNQTVRVTIKNPFDRETHCQVNCQFSTQHAGKSFQISCTREVQPGVDAEICKQVYDKEPLVKMTGGDGDCIKQQPLEEEKAEQQKSDDDDEAMIQKMMKDSQDFIERNRQK
jgi:hypothetical protein